MSETFSNIVRTNNGAAPMAALHVEVIADLICPFCFIGKRRLDAAMQAVQGPSEVRWYPYQLNPDMPANGMSFEDYLARRFGNPANIQPVLDSLMAEGKACGIQFRFDRLKHVPNTLAAHHVMHLAENEGLDQSALADDILLAFFERGENIGKRSVLLELADAHGLAARDVNRVIDDSQTRQIVLSRERQVRASGMTGVPGFLLNRRLLVVGAQETANIINAFDRAMFGEGDEEVTTPALH
ncbi:MAG: DsbA family oxidoreductase [Gammaproteobacteria bacterium]|nr:DsbA family oxidoreductase [Gammaproteobacteria bacterium]